MLSGMKLAFAGGAAKRGSEIFKEERETALANSTEQLKILTTLGLPAAAEYKQKSRLKSKMFGDLKKLGFDGDRIAVIMEQGQGQDVIDFVNAKKKVIEDYKVNPAEIVTFAEGYEKHGYTEKEVLELVLGKVEKGVPVGDAISEVTGKSSTLTEALGGNFDSIGQKRIENVAAAAGVSIDELQAYASDSLTFDPIAVKGTVSLFDEAAAAKAAGDTFTADKARTRLTSYGAGQIIGGEMLGATSDGVPIYALDAGIAKGLLDNKVSELVAEREKRNKGRPLTSADILEMEQEIVDWARNTELEEGSGTYLHATLKPNVVVESGAVSNDGSVSGPLDVTNLSVNELQDKLREELKTINGKKPTPLMAEALRKQITSAIRERMKRDGITNELTIAQRAESQVNAILKNAGYGQPGKENTNKIDLVDED